MRRIRSFTVVVVLGYAACAPKLETVSQDDSLGVLAPASVPKFVTPLVVPPAMPRTLDDSAVDYQVAQRQFRQQILPPDFPATTVWGYGSLDAPGTVAEGGSFHAPSFTIEATWNQPLTVKWVNDLVDDNGRFLPHLLPIDQTLDWANPARACADHEARTDCMGIAPTPYRGPVPMIVHLHGAHVDGTSDGMPMAWYLPAATNLPAHYATRGRHFAQIDGAPDVQGQAIFRYPNDQPATTLWFHDHALGVTRANVYAGPAGFYLVRGGPGDVMTVSTTGAPATLPGPAPGLGADPFARWYEIPLAIQDRTFYADGSLFYPTSRALFDGFAGPYAPATDVPPIWNPEFFGNAIMVNGRTWPYLDVEPRRYRFRFLNGANSRFLILAASDPRIRFWQLGGDSGFLPAPIALDELLLGPAERADVIVDFSALAPGTNVTLLNRGPDEPFGGGLPGVDFAPADPTTTGQVMQFRVVPLASVDDSTPPELIALPAPTALPAATSTRRVSLNELDSDEVCIDDRGSTRPCTNEHEEHARFGPIRALLGTIDDAGLPVPRRFGEEITENIELGATEIWELYNLTADAHPIHLHLVQFEILDRQALARVGDDDDDVALPVRVTGTPRPPEAWETGRKDTVVVYPGEVARVKARFDLPGLFEWHCHILEHEDNEMMRPFLVGAP